MHTGVKLIIGIIVFLAGIYWYLPGTAIPRFFGVASNFQSFLVVFSGLFGIFLILFGLIIAWIEYEDLRWKGREKKKK